MSEGEIDQLVDNNHNKSSRKKWIIIVVCSLLALVLVLGLVIGLGSRSTSGPSDALSRAFWIMSRYPCIDGHNDLPWQYRTRVKTNVSAIDIGVLQPSLQTDIPRLKLGRVGGQFWSVYVGCNYANKDAVRATQEQIDVVYQVGIFMLLL